MHICSIAHIPIWKCPTFVHSTWRSEEDLANVLGLMCYGTPAIGKSAEQGFRSCQLCNHIQPNMHKISAPDSRYRLTCPEKGPWELNVSPALEPYSWVQETILRGLYWNVPSGIIESTSWMFQKTKSICLKTISSQQNGIYADFLSVRKLVNCSSL